MNTKFIVSLLLINTSLVYMSARMPVMHYDTVNAYYKEFTGNDMPLLKGMITDYNEFSRRTSPLDVADYYQMAVGLCGSGPKIFPDEIMRKYPSFWQESRETQNYISRFDLVDENYLPTIPFITATGFFNTKIKCINALGCFMFNNRSTTVTIIPYNVTLPTTYDVAAFILKPDGDSSYSCGFDSSLDGNGYYANSTDEYAKTPIFRNVLNKAGMLTADAFSDADINSGPGADAGWGANKYVATRNIVNRTICNYIFSTFDSPDPLTGLPFFLGRQTTKYCLKSGNPYEI